MHSDNANGRFRRNPVAPTRVGESFTSNTRTGRAIFLTCCSPLSSKAKPSLSRTWSRTTRLMEIPPGAAKASRRAATLTPSP